MPTSATARRVYCRVAATAAIALLMLMVQSLPARANHLDDELSISVSGPITLQSGVVARVPVQITCPTLEDPFSTIFSNEISVSLTQKSGRTLVTGGGSVYYQSPVFNGVGVGTAVVCDGSAQTVTIDVFPNTTGGPFHGGPAVASGFFRLTLYDPMNPNPFATDQSSVSTGTQSISIRGG
jgi:hypothetical protein